MENFIDTATTIRALGLMVLGALVLIGAFWQYKVCRNDYEKAKRRQLPTRIKIGISICVLFLIGIVARDLIAIHLDVRRHFTYEMLWAELLIAISICLLLLLQTYFGPAVTCYALLMSAYFFFEHHEVYVLPIFQSTIDIIASFGPDWTDNVYIIIMGTYTAAVSLKDAIA